MASVPQPNDQRTAVPVDNADAAASSVNGRGPVNGQHHAELGGVAELRRDSVSVLIRSNSYDQAISDGVTLPQYLKNEAESKRANCASASPLWQRLLPFNPFKASERQKGYPMLTTGWLSLISFHWVNYLLLIGFRRPVEMKDLWNIHPADSADIAGDRLKDAWRQELQRANGDVDKARLGRAFYKAHGRGILLAIFFMFLYQVMSFLSSSIFVFQLVQFTERPPESSTLADGLIVAFAFLINELLRSFFFSIHWYFALQSALRFRAALNMIVFDKVMRLRNLGKMTIGQVVNLCVNDGQRMFECAMFTGFMVGAPTMSVAVIIYTVLLVGWPAVLGCVTFLIFYPIQGVFGKKIGMNRRIAIGITDKRVRKMNEILNFVKLIKMYAWEDAFAKQIASVRREERRYLEKSALFTALTFSLTPIAPVVAAVLTFSVKTLTGGSLTASEAFAVLASFTAMRFSLAVLPLGVRALSEANVAMPRVKALLALPDIVRINSSVGAPDGCIELHDACFAWDARQAPENADASKRGGESRRNSRRESTSKVTATQSSVSTRQGRKESTARLTLSSAQEDDEAEIPDTLIGLNLAIKCGQLIGVCGPFGSGKTSVLTALLGGMNLRSGSASLKGSVAYVSQQAWIINASLRDNILFGAACDEERYQRVLSAAALQADLKILPDGDMTEIGERGINLSGGQKQRVSLARALYADRDVYLLDDPLSAVDAHVGAHIFNELIKRELKGKTVMLVTHQLQYLQSCDSVLMMTAGRIAENGTYAQLMEAGGAFRALMDQYLEEAAQEDEDDDDANDSVDQIERVLEVLKSNSDIETVQRQLSAISTRSGEETAGSPTDASTTRSPRKRKARAKKATEELAAAKSPQKLVEAEDRATGSVAWSTYLAFARAAGGVAVSIFIFVWSVLTVLSGVANNYWVSYWLREGDGNSTNNANGTQATVGEDISENPRLVFYVGIYYALLVVVTVFSLVRGIVFVKILLKASSNLHNYVFKRVFRAPMVFFDTTPTGRILNRFSKDLDEIDTQLPWLLSNATLNTITMTGAITLSAVIYPILLAPIAAVLVLFAIVHVLYTRGIRELKRLENISRSPLISHLGSSIQGLGTIHAFRKNSEFHAKFKQHLDQNTIALQGFQSVARWLALRLDLLATILIFFTGLFLVLNKDAVPVALAGLAITYIVQIGGLLQFTVRTISEVQARFTSVERINHYATHIAIEAAEHIPETEPPPEWPSQGRVTFDNVCMRYREGTPQVLHELSFDVKAQEKIGVIGRTGAGKSSLAVCLLRLVELDSGRILIDDIDVSTLGLRDLRSRLSIIPQDPVLFVGTIRYNLDPFDKHSDEALERALQQTHLKDTIDQLPNGLDTEVLENGENFSVGERQLMCMARALLRHSKILILDEATASIDTETDTLIQKTIRECFGECTLLTIAHRLNTVLDSDRLLVLDGGRVAEFDTPANLMSDRNSIVTRMLSSPVDGRYAPK
eukprot:scpid14143/ scgid13961/ Multidrug resistance-associated protein 5; ATP-binding cassette sub-family C member 5; Multi-specific organic anion transporter C; SMRP; pABC11